MDADSPQRPLTPVSLDRPRPAKFRSSCDACSASKIKCDQERPSCLRCSNLGIKCNYSPSRRMGKPSAASRDLANAAKGAKAPQAKASIPQKRPLQPPSRASSTAPAEAALLNQTGPALDTFLMEPDDLMPFDWITNNPQMDNSSASDTSFLSDHLLCQTKDLMDPLITQQLTRLSSTDGTTLFDDDCQFSFSPPTPNVSYEDLQATEDPSSDAIFQTHPSHQLHSCTRLASSTLHDLHLEFEPSPNSLAKSYGQPISTTDRVLINNKAAIENAYTLLACPCILNPHFALTLGLICHKVLERYEAIVQATPLKAPASNPVSHNTQSLLATPITVGAYKMDAEDEQRMRVQLVVNELRKVKGLVEKFTEKYCASIDRNRDPNEGIYLALEQFLRSNLTRMTNDMINRLDV